MREEVRKKGERGEKRVMGQGGRVRGEGGRGGRDNSSTRE